MPLPLSFVSHLLPVVLMVTPALPPPLFPLFLDLLRALPAAVAPVLCPSLDTETYLVASAIVTDRLRLELRLPTTAVAGITVLLIWVLGRTLVTYALYYIC